MTDRSRNNNMPESYHSSLQPQIQVSPLNLFTLHRHLQNNVSDDDDDEPQQQQDATTTQRRHPVTFGTARAGCGPA